MRLNGLKYYIKIIIYLEETKNLGVPLGFLSHNILASAWVKYFKLHWPNFSSFFEKIATKNPECDH